MAYDWQLQQQINNLNDIIRDLNTDRVNSFVNDEIDLFENMRQQRQIRELEDIQNQLEKQQKTD